MLGGVSSSKEVRRRTLPVKETGLEGPKRR